MANPLARFAIFCRALVAVALVVVGTRAKADAQPPQVVRSTGAPAWGADLRLVEEVRIGTLDGADEYILGRVGSVAVGRDGVIVVADEQVPVIRMYDARGKFIRNVGRKGGGPGEYEAIGGMRTLPDGRVALWDNRNQRITLFTPAGELAESHRVVSGLFASDIFQVDRTGHFYVRTVVGRPVDGGDWDEGWIRVSPIGKLVDTIPIPKEANAPRSFVLSGPSGYDRPFTPQLVTAMSSNGYLITGHNTTYAFEQHLPNGPVRRIERAYTPVPVARAERGEWEAWASILARPAAARPGQPAVRSAPRPASYAIPDIKPAYKDLRTDSQGRIWVRRYVAAQSRPGPERKPGDERPRRVWKEPQTFDVFEAEGTFLGTITLPFDAYLYDAIDRHIWATVRGESDEEYVVRFRIEDGGRTR